MPVKVVFGGMESKRAADAVERKPRKPAARPAIEIRVVEKPRTPPQEPKSYFMADVKVGKG